MDDAQPIAPSFSLDISLFITSIILLCGFLIDDLTMYEAVAKHKNMMAIPINNTEIMSKALSKNGSLKALAYVLCLAPCLIIG